MSGSQQLLLGGAPTVTPVDPYFYSVTSLLHGDGTNGGQNNTFLDSSSNNFTITRNGNTTQGSFSPFSQTGWGNYFDGSGDWLDCGTNAAFTVGTGALTIEAWVYCTSLSQPYQGIISGRSGVGPTYAGLGLVIDNGYVSFTINELASALTDTVTIPLNQWVHVVGVRSGTNASLFVNGVKKASSTSNSVNGTSNVLGIGRFYYGTNNYYFNGYISNARLVKGTAAYDPTASTITVPTTPLTAISGTSLLTCQSNRFIDNSSNAFAITRNGDVSVQPFSPFNPTTPYSTSSIGGSGYFDGSGDSLTFTDSSNALDLGGATASVEFWVYAPNVSSGQGIFNKSGGTDSWNTTNGYEYNIYISGGVLYFYYNNAGGAGTDVSATIVASQWTHVAVATNSSNAISLYINGSRVDTATNAITKPSTRTTMRVGNTAANEYFSGYLSGLRFISGSGAYDASQTTITIPTAPPTAVTNTAFLLNFTNGAIFDNAAVADYETVGNAQISTSVKKYGTGSMAFDGTGDWLVTPTDARLLELGSGDFTVEAWVYPANVSGGKGIVDFRTSAADTAGFYFGLNGSQLQIYSQGVINVSAGVIPATAWTHVACNRTAGVIKLYINGTAVSSTANTTNWTRTSMTVGAAWRGGGDPMNGYIDDLRVSKGIGRYPYNFTPPTAEFPNIGGTVTLTADPYYDYTTLLLPGNGTNGAQNNTFLDSSTNAFSITRNGNTTQGTFSPFSQTGWGNHFGSSGSYLTLADATQFNLSGGNYTLECWIFPNGNYADYNTILAKRVASSNTTAWEIFLNISTGVLSYFDGTIRASAVTPPSNQWSHVAAVYDGTNINLYLNGTRVLQTAVSNTNQSASVYVGAYATAEQFLGYISNVRITKGAALYTGASFTVPTTALTTTVSSGTVSLLTCQSNRFVDNSTNAAAITVSGSPSIQAFSPFNPTAAWSASTNGGSGYFDGSGDYLTVPHNAAFDFGSGDFTMEAWVYPTTASLTSELFDKRASAANYSQMPQIQITANQPIAYASATGSSWAVSISGSSNVKPYSWNHVALTRSGSTWTLWLNGASIGTATSSITVYASTSNVVIGAADAAGTNPMNGYLAGSRIVKGTAVYTTAFTPPTAPLTAISGTSLLLNYTNAGIYDATAKNDLETVGNAQISTTQSKFGGSSMYFDGTGDWLLTPSSQNAVMGSGDFTWEAWVYFASGSTFRQIFSTRASSATASTTAASLSVNTTNGLTWFTNSAIVSYATSIGVNQWVHVAVSRYGTTLRVFANGIQVGSATNSDNLTASILSVGGNNDGSEAFNGYINDLRITKGIARYTSNFTPPTTAFLTR